jgi:hypothetical protein
MHGCLFSQPAHPAGQPHHAIPRSIQHRSK